MPDSKITVWKNYQAAWRDVTAPERQALLARSVSDDCVYTDPAGVRTGREALTEYLEQFQQRLPGGYFVNTRFIEHHQQAIANWTRHNAHGQPDIDGTSYARFGSDGRLIQMSGFPHPS